MKLVLNSKSMSNAPVKVKPVGLKSEPIEGTSLGHTDPSIAVHCMPEGSLPRASCKQDQTIFLLLEFNCALLVGLPESIRLAIGERR